MKHFSAAISLIFGVIGLLYYVVIMSWGFNVTQWSNTMSASVEHDESTGDTRPDPGPMPRDPFNWVRDWGRSGSTFAQDELNDRRIVRYSEVVPARTFFEEGEALPPDAQIAVYVSARLPLYAMRRCPEILEIIATRCVVTDASASLNSEDIGADAGFRLNYTLAYQPAYDVTTDQATRSNSTTSALVRFYGRRSDDPVANTEAERLRVMQAAVEICDQIRGIYGSCAATRVLLDAAEERIYNSGSDNSGDLFREILRARVEFSTLGMSSREGRDRFEGHVMSAASAVWVGPLGD